MFHPPHPSVLPAKLTTSNRNCPRALLRISIQQLRKSASVKGFLPTFQAAKGLATVGIATAPVTSRSSAPTWLQHHTRSRSRQLCLQTLSIRSPSSRQSSHVFAPRSTLPTLPPMQVASRAPRPCLRGQRPTHSAPVPAAPMQ